MIRSAVLAAAMTVPPALADAKTRGVNVTGSCLDFLPVCKASYAKGVFVYDTLHATGFVHDEIAVAVSAQLTPSAAPLPAAGLLVVAAFGALVLRRKAA